MACLQVSATVALVAVALFALLASLPVEFAFSGKAKSGFSAIAQDRAFFFCQCHGSILS